MSSAGQRTPSRLLIQEDRFAANSNWVDHVAAILTKRPEHRSHAEHSFLLKKLLNIKYFQELAKSSDPEIIKYVVKNTKIVRPRRTQIIIRKDDPIDYFYVILKGRVGIEQDLYAGEQIVDPLKIHIMIQVLEEQIARTEVKTYRRAKQTNKDLHEDLAVYQSKTFVQHELPLEKLKFTDQLGEEESFGDEIKNIQAHRKYNAVAIQDCILLQIKFSAFLKAIKYYTEKKLYLQFQFFRKFRCFDLLQDHQLKNLIPNCKIDERGKNEYVFKQNESAAQFYLLYEGEVCLVKNAQLFVENPNKLYANRKMYLQRKRNSEPLPYANLEKLYNYRPKQEKIQLGILEKDSLFGEQQAFLRTPRQTDAKVCSNIARYYIIGISALEVVLKEKKYQLEDFRDYVFANMTRKKIMYRQEKFSQVLNIRNKNQLDYFYIGDDEKEEKQSPMKFKLQKINNRVQELSKGKKLHSAEIEDKPYYDPFNFTKLLANQEDIFLDDPQSPQEKKLVNLTHTTCFIQKQINSQSVFSKLRNPVKHKINLKDPLFEPMYFENINKQLKKMDQQYRKKRFTLKPIERKSYSNSNRSRKAQI